MVISEKLFPVWKYFWFKNVFNKIYEVLPNMLVVKVIRGLFYSFFEVSTFLLWDSRQSVSKKCQEVKQNKIKCNIKWTQIYNIGEFD